MQNYGDYYNSLEGVYAPQVQQIQQQQAALPAQFDAQRTALEQAKTNAFKGIANTANARGVYFSGFQPDQQATYTGATYLPAVAKVAAAQTQAQSQLQQALNDVTAKRTTHAQSLWQQELDRQQAQRQFEAKQAQDQQQYQQQLSLANARSSGGGKAPSVGEIKLQVTSHIANQLAGSHGRDGKVSPETWAAAFNDYAATGGNARSFWQSFGQYAKKGYAGYAAR